MTTPAKEDPAAPWGDPAAPWGETEASRAAYLERVRQVHAANQERAAERWRALPDDEKRRRIKMHLARHKAKSLGERLTESGGAPYFHDAPAWFGTFVIPPYIGRNVDGFDVDRLRALYAGGISAAKEALSLGGTKRLQGDLDGLDREIQELEAEAERNEARADELAGDVGGMAALGRVGIASPEELERTGHGDEWVRLWKSHRAALADRDRLWMRHTIFLNVLKRHRRDLPTDLEDFFALIEPTHEEWAAACEREGVPPPPPAATPSASGTNHPRHTEENARRALLFLKAVEREPGRTWKSRNDLARASRGGDPLDAVQEKALVQSVTAMLDALGHPVPELKGTRAGAAALVSAILGAANGIREAARHHGLAQ